MNPPSSVIESFQLVVDIVSPTHIGTGSGPLVNGFDYVVEDAAIVVVDVDRALHLLANTAVVANGQIAEAVPAVARPDVAQYTIPFAGGRAPRAILPTAKLTDARPMAPGSTLKGGLRSVLATALLERERAAGTAITKADLVLTARNDLNFRFAGQQIERRLFGPRPTASILRALRVSDALPVDDASVGVIASRVYSVDAEQLSADPERTVVEVVPQGTRLIGSLGIDRHLLRLADPRLDGAVGRAILDELIVVGQAESRRRIAAERAYFAAAGSNPLVAFYDALAAEAESPSDGSFLIQLAWGAGWSAKSFGEPLTASADWVAIRDEILANRGAGQRRRGPRGGRPGPAGPGPRQPGRPKAHDRSFPFTRRIAEYAGAAMLPFGWARLTLTPVGQPLPDPIAPPTPWRVAALEAPPRVSVPAAPEPVVAGRQETAPPPVERPSEPLSPFAQLQALLGQAAPKPEAEKATVERAPIPSVSDKALKVGTVLEAEVVAVEEKRLLVNVGRSEPATMEPNVLGGGNLPQRYQVGQRLRVKVITAPPFFRIRLA